MSYNTLINQVLTEGLTGTIDTFESFPSSFEMNEKASQNDLILCESNFKVDLPVEYKSFPKKYNGGILFKFADHSGFNFFGTTNIKEENHFQKENFGDHWDDSIILFCLCIGDGEYLGFRLLNGSKYSIIHCIMEEMPGKWQVIENSFDEFLYKLIKERGRKYWLNSLSE